MARSVPSPTVQQLRRLVEDQRARALSDQELLRQFRGRHDVLSQDAFGALLRRHGPMVLSVARVVVGNEADAEDVFQATFLVLARKAASIHKTASLGSWLHGVALRTALKARADSARRRKHEARAPRRRACEPEDLTWSEVQHVLHEELNALPERHRAALVLCYLQGRTQDEAASLLRLPKGTLRSRLERGRELLRRRLARRGLGPAAAMLALTWPGAGEAALPPSLAAATARAAAGLATGRAAPGLISPGAVVLAEGAMKPMSAALRLKATVLFVLAVAAAGVGLRFRPPLTEHARAAPPPKAPPTDGAGDPLPPGAVGRLGTVRLRHGAGVTSVAFSPDGTRLASGSLDWWASLWDVKTGKELRQFGGQEGAVLAVAFSPDGKVLATAGDARSQVVLLRDVASGKTLHKLDGHKGSIFAVAFSPDGKWLASAGEDGTVRLWGPATGRNAVAPLRRKAAVRALAFSPDSRWLAAGEMDRAAIIWDVKTGKEVQTLPESGLVQALAFSPDGKMLAVGSQGGSTLWEAAPGKGLVTRHRLAAPGADVALAFRPDGKALIVGNRGGAVRVLDVATGKEVHHYRAHGDELRAVAVSPDGKVIASGGNDGCVHLAGAATGKELLPQPGHSHQVRDVAYSRDGKLIATAGMEGAIILWDAATCRDRGRLKGHERSVRAIALSDDGRALVSASEDGTVRVWDAASGRERRKLPAHPGGARGVALSPDGARFVSGGADGAVRLWETATGRALGSWRVGGRKPGPVVVKPLAGGAGGGPVEQVAYAPDGATFAAVGHQTVAVWDAATGKQLWHAHDAMLSQLLCVTYAPDGKTLATASGGAAGRVHLWEARTGTGRHVFQGKPGLVLSLAFSPDGRLLAVTGGGQVVHLLEVSTGKEVHALGKHRGWVRAAAFAPDGKRLASAGGDTTGLVWNVSALGRPAPARLTAKEAAALWDDLAEMKDGTKVHRAVGGLGAAPDQALPLLRQHLRPAASLSPEQQTRITRLVVGLDADSFRERQKASAELEEFGEDAVPALRKALEGVPSPELRRRAGELLNKLTGSELTAERLRLLRALEVLERLDTPESRRLVEALSRGAPGAWLTREAQRIGQRQSRRGPGWRR